MVERVVYKSASRRRVTSKPSEHTSPTKQAFKDSCDINKILEKWNKGQEITHINPKTPLYGDFTQFVDLQDSINRVNAAEQAFSELPAAVRSWASNDPVRFLELATDPANEEALIEMGLLPPDSSTHSTSTVTSDTPETPAVAPKEEPTDDNKA